MDVKQGQTECFHGLKGTRARQKRQLPVTFLCGAYLHLLSSQSHRRNSNITTPITSPTLSELAAAQNEVERLEIESLELQLETSRRRRQIAQQQLEAEQKQVEADEKKLELARAQRRVEMLRASMNVDSNRANVLPAPTATPADTTTATTAPVLGLPSYGDARGLKRDSRGFALDNRGPQDSSANTVGMSGNGSVGGVSQRCFAATSPTFRVTGNTTHMPDLVAAGEEVMQSSGSIAVELSNEPMRPEQPSFLKETAQHVTSSTRPQETREKRIKVFSSQPGISCLSCRKHHPIRDCLFAPQGYIPGCILCNTSEHPVDICDQFKQMSTKEKAELLVYERSNRPMLHTSPDRPAWQWYLEEYLKEAGPGAIPSAVPWTSAFAKKVQARPDFHDIQAQWDTERDVDSLPKDPGRSYLNVIHRLYGSDRI
ncbi:uncharacterized protein FIESC28_02096 [Fusarium coffeatum]|uniref:Uncharacterized protein n=1 Tax=Fusarium coffeatum TaxID=231269 RepID=A0A366S8F3_9HYPO|nr:uncharacterized protein FIESC28_02096 [Fusarium coffeatum]RBR25188.1 hypothetical protein FIESC28_02096 [Fusarium coffeatum]